MNNYKSADEYANKMERTASKVLKIIGFVILGILFLFGIGFVVMLLWNRLMPDLFGLKEISYWQGMGILALGRILFGGFGGGSNSSSSENKHKTPSGVIADEIHKEMQKEFKKEFYEKYSEELETKRHTPEDNKANEDLYEEWWQKEGEKTFEAYLNQK